MPRVLAVMGRGEQSPDNLGERVRRGVCDEGLDLLRCGRQANEVECGAANKRASFGGRGEAAFTESGQDEGVDGRSIQ